jgi:hypothetical protein
MSHLAKSVSRDVVFDEQNFHFYSKHNNVGARLKSEISCLHPTLLNPSYGDKCVAGQFTNHPPDCANNLVEIHDTTSEEEITRNNEATGNSSIEHETDPVSGVGGGDSGNYPWH